MTAVTGAVIRVSMSLGDVLVVIAVSVAVGLVTGAVIARWRR